jgi:hypothetical protein
MYPSGHKKLAIFIAEKFAIPEEFRSELIKGSLDPDRKKSIFERKEPHHFDRDKDIENYLWKARRNFIKGKMKECYYYLGFALHFVGDAPIYSPAIYRRYRRGRGAGLKTWHAKRRAKKLHKIFEKDVSVLEVSENLLLFILDTPLEIPSTIEKFLYKDSFYNPQHTLSRIYQVSYAFSEIVLRNIPCQKEIELIKEIPLRKRKYLLKTFLIFLVLIISFIWSKFFFVFIFTFLILLLEKKLFDPFGIQNPWKLEGWYRKNISFLGLSED